MPSDLVNNHNRRPRDMTWEELDAEIGQLRGQEEASDRDLEWAKGVAGRKDLIGVRADFHQHVENLKKKGSLYRRQILDVRTEQHMRPALCLGCMFFVLVGWFLATPLPEHVYFSAADSRYR